MYKDREQAKQSNKERQRRYRALRKGVTSEGVTEQGVTIHTAGLPLEPAPVFIETPEGLVDIDKLPANYGQPDCECRHCQNIQASGSKHIINHAAYKPASELGKNELNRVSKPGDADYKGVCSHHDNAGATT